MLGCLDMVLEQVQRNLKHDWWSDVAVVGGSVLHPMYPYPCSKKVTRTNTRITKLLTVECGLAAGCFVAISSPPIYNFFGCKLLPLDASKIYTTSCIELEIGLEWKKTTTVNFRAIFRVFTTLARTLSL